jgi:hypothetical protein
MLTTAVGDRQIAYNDGKKRVCNADAKISELTDRTLGPGVYCTPGGAMALTTGDI